MKITSKSVLPTTTIPIALIGAGGIVRDAHLPAYRKAGFNVLGIYDLNEDLARQLAQEFGIPEVCRSIEELIGVAIVSRAVFDLAVPASQIIQILSHLPDGSAVLIQKPMGENLVEAQRILSLCHQKQLIGAVNFQLRYAPFVNAARSMITAGAIGEIYDMEVKLCTFTPWHLWEFLSSIPRVEILYHSIHYLDLIRSFLGDPQRVMAKTVKHPSTTVASSRSAILLDYGDELSATINTNHDHNFGPRHQQSFIKWEGTKGAIYAKMGLNLNYPKGVPDVFEYIVRDGTKTPIWQSIVLQGSWFPDAFIGSMSSLMRFVEGSEDVLTSSVEDAFKTMKAVEAAYKSSEGK
ncbi:MAG: Gfo/Idh/MocA family oxidoreductase [Saprospiraceae bacterium]|nr:Gfo/Idh/MocA family oxidoreductase [Saprospiraceae bacterium]